MFPTRTESNLEPFWQEATFGDLEIINISKNVFLCTYIYVD